MEPIKCYFSIHEIHKNSQRIFSDNYNSNERTRMIISQAVLYGEDKKPIGKIIDRSTKIMDETHTTLVDFYLYIPKIGKISINEIIFFSDEQPFHKNFTFEVIKNITYTDTLNPNYFYNKNMKIIYTNKFDEFKGEFEIIEIV